MARNRVKGITMYTDLLETVPLSHRLAISYAPRAQREVMLVGFALDARLAKIVQGKGESLIAQMKLAWWRDRLAQDPTQWPKGEPVLEMLATSALEPALLAPMVDGWEQLLAEELDQTTVTAFANGRAALWDALAATDKNAGERRRDLAMQAGREWAFVDLALHLDHEDDRAEVMALAKGEAWSVVNLPRALRPLAVLHALAKRASHNGLRDVLDGPGAMFTALRVGILGR